METPPVVEEQEYNSIFFDAMPESDSYVMTLMGVDSKGVIDFDYKGTVSRAQAVEFHWGTLVEGKAYFFKTWPKKWITAPKSHTALAFQALTGELPTTLDADFVVGKAALINIENVAKTSAKGTHYTASKQIGSPNKVPSSMRSLVIPREDLMVAWEAAMEPKEQQQEEDGNDAPF